MKIQIELEEKNKVMCMIFPPETGVVIKIDASYVDDLLQTMGRARGLMSPPHEGTWKGGSATAMRDPSWVSQPDAMTGESLLHIRDQRFGWLHYLFSAESALKLAGLLKTQAENPPRTPPPDERN